RGRTGLGANGWQLRQDNGHYQGPCGETCRTIGEGRPIPGPQPPIRDDERISLGSKTRPRFGGGRCDIHLVAVALQSHCQQLADALIVLDQKDPLLRHVISPGAVPNSKKGSEVPQKRPACVDGSRTRPQYVTGSRLA